MAKKAKENTPGLFDAPKTADQIKMENAQDLYNFLFEACNILRGPVSQDNFKDYITPILYYKRISDVYDEEMQAALEESGGDMDYAMLPEQHRFDIPDGCHWKDVRERTENLGAAIVGAMRKIELANPDTLYGVLSMFSSQKWTNKSILTDGKIRDLIEHLSTRNLGNNAYPADLMGDAYEVLLKKFADDSKAQAGEFYTPRSVVSLLVRILDPKPGETVYDPACGSGGMLIEAVHHMHHDNLCCGSIFGQEKNVVNAAIAKMNLYLNGVEDFSVVCADTLERPAFVDGSRLRKFDIVLANPPYSIKQWNREKFMNDKWGRNFLGTPPQGRADYAFFQHILASMDDKTGRCAILFPHGVLFRKEEQEIRKNLVEKDLIECVIGLGPNLFYNSPMEACILICRTNKSDDYKNKVVFINAVNEVVRKNAESYLTDEHICRIREAYFGHMNVENLCKIVSCEEVLNRNADLNISLYVTPKSTIIKDCLTEEEAITRWESTSVNLHECFTTLLEQING